MCGLWVTDNNFAISDVTSRKSIKCSWTTAPITEPIMPTAPIMSITGNEKTKETSKLKKS